MFKITLVSFEHELRKIVKSQEKRTFCFVDQFSPWMEKNTFNNLTLTSLHRMPWLLFSYTVILKFSVCV